MNALENNVTGEARLKQRRRGFIKYVAIAMAIAFGAGIGSGVLGAFVALDRLPAWPLWIVWALVTAGFVWFSRDYFRRVDEVDLMDNLWASLIAFYVYVILFGSWWLFADLGLLGPMNHFAIFWVTLAAGIIAYVARKLGWR
jgi:hypothetical protein